MDSVTQKSTNVEVVKWNRYIIVEYTKQQSLFIVVL